MTTVLEVSASGKDNVGQQWTPALGLDEEEAAPRGRFLDGHRVRGAPTSLGTPDHFHQEEKVWLDQPPRSEDQFEGIIGRSASLCEVFAQLKIVAPTGLARIRKCNDYN